MFRTGLSWILAAESATSPPAGAQPPAAQSGSDIMGMLPLFVILFVILYFFMIAPQRKKEKARRAMIDAVAKGDKVVTIGGIHGEVWQIKDQEVVLLVGENTRMTFSRGAVARVIKGDKDSGA